MADKHYVPRWRYQRVEVPASATIRADVVPFSNTESWPWHLAFLSMVGHPVVAAGFGDFSTMVGGVAGRLELKQGISQWGSLNLVPVMASAAMPNLRNPLTRSNWVVSGSHFKFERPVILGPDDAMIAEVQNNGDNIAGNFSLVFNGYRDREGGSREPEQLAGRLDEDLDPGVSTTLDSSDLYNDGESDFNLVDMIIDTSSGSGLIPSPVPTPVGDKSRWRINPATGVQWMDQAELIPEGNIAPFNRLAYDRWDMGPRAFEYPAGTVMRRRQRLEVYLTNLTSLAQTVDLCLFGYLEVS